MMSETKRAKKKTTVSNEESTNRELNTIAFICSHSTDSTKTNANTLKTSKYENELQTRAHAHNQSERETKVSNAKKKETAKATTMLHNWISFTYDWNPWTIKRITNKSAISDWIAVRIRSNDGVFVVRVCRCSLVCSDFCVTHAYIQSVEKSHTKTNNDRFDD